ncbi:SpoIIE family protein phosphatase [Cellulomonas sp.]|uniref:SpoIIE family protein phosphatase n=1 Tax=Cellulomonas sp. TaxID=40001 RepID=UPI002D4012F8|nr:SpoIIE family protein phosphatase [Cellulomonas sp.]HYQ74901.1 SpoIIE family protein phosphatase [Cellulomonas sp.]
MTAAPEAPLRVLVVDDTEAHRYVMASWLRRAGYAVTEAGTGRAALELAPGHDAVVLDVNLPDMSGFDVCGAIKADEATAVPVMHVSATSIDARSRTSGLQRGADAYLVEPLDRDEFLVTVAALCRSHAARRGITEHARRLADLAAAVVPLASAGSLDDLVARAAQGGATVFDAPVVVIATAPDGMATRVVCAGPGRPVVRGRLLAPASEPPTGEPHDLPAADTPGVWREMLDRAGVEVTSWHVSPLTDAAGRLIGGFAVSTPEPFDAEDRELALQLRAALTGALATLRSYAQEHLVALTLQRSMLPHTLPDPAGVRMAARYSASDAQLSVGGDFYDALDLPDGRVAVVIGDVQGHSLRAATVMAQLRFSLAAYLLEGHPPARALDLLNDLLRRTHPELVTVCVAVLDLRDGTIEVANAGHLPPLLVTAGGAEYLRATSPLLGVPAAGERAVARVATDGPCTLVLVTDGLLERRSGHLRDALGRMAAVAAEAGTLEPGDLCDVLLRRFDNADQDDDVAVLAVHLTGERAAV